ncbi:hypothetical protein Efla_003534 [Eimeria flavescens]
MHACSATVTTFFLDAFAAANTAAAAASVAAAAAAGYIVFELLQRRGVRVGLGLSELHRVHQGPRGIRQRHAPLAAAAVVVAAAAATAGAAASDVAAPAAAGVGAAAAAGAGGLAVSPKDAFLISGGDDRKIKQWRLPPRSSLSLLDVEAAVTLQADEELMRQMEETGTVNKRGIDPEPVNVFKTESPVTISTGETVQLWEPHRSSPLQTFSWGSDAVYCAKFNPSETSLFAAGLGGNSVALYDIRGNTPIRRVLMKMKTNAISWNPREPVNFTVANEDQNLYTYDLRKLSEALKVHKDFVNAVLDVDYSPTGKEFVAASFDGTIRIFKTEEGRSRDVYHTRRMQRQAPNSIRSKNNTASCFTHFQCQRQQSGVLSCVFSSDARFVLSGSADMCIRLWKAEAAAPLGPQTYKSRVALNYRRTLQEKFGHLQEIKRIARHRHVPKLIRKTQEKKRIMREAAKRREENRIAHSKPGKHIRVPERKKAIYREIE